MSINYNATLNRVINGSTIDMNVELNPGEYNVIRIRLAEIRTGNTQKLYHLSFEGSYRIMAELAIKQWFYERSSLFYVNYYTIDICGRWLSDIIEVSSSDSLINYMKSLNYTDDRWSELSQDDLKNEWFGGEVVTVPDGDELPLFQPWGKLSFLGYKSRMLNWGC